MNEPLASPYKLNSGPVLSAISLIESGIWAIHERNVVCMSQPLHDSPKIIFYIHYRPVKP